MKLISLKKIEINFWSSCIYGCGGQWGPSMCSSASHFLWMISFDCPNNSLGWRWGVTILSFHMEKPSNAETEGHSAGLSDATSTVVPYSGASSFADVVGKCFPSPKKKSSFKLLYVLVLNCLILKVKQCHRKYFGYFSSIYLLVKLASLWLSW